MGRYEIFLDKRDYDEVTENRGKHKRRYSAGKTLRKKKAKASGFSAVLCLTLLIVAGILLLSAMFSALGKETGSHYKLNPSYQNYTSASTSQTSCHTAAAE